MTELDKIIRQYWPTGINDDNNPIVLVAKEYAIFCCEEQKKICYKHSYCDMEHPDEDNGLEESAYCVSKDSILNAPTYKEDEKE